MIQDKKQLITIDNLFKVLQSLKYVIFEDKLNIVVLRSSNQNAGKFDDIECVFWKQDNEWVLHTFNCTADPSDLYLKNPTNTLGCGILVPGQYIDSWCYGLHKGYPALTQLKKLTVIRDNNKDSILDYNRPKIYTKCIESVNGYNTITRWYLDSKVIFTEERGIFGLNNHRASQFSVVPDVGLYSAACIVIQYPKGWDMFIGYIREWKDKQNNRFTIALVTEQQFDKGLNMEYTSTNTKVEEATVSTVSELTPLSTLRTTTTSAIPIFTTAQADSPAEVKYGIRKNPFIRNEE